MKTQNKTLAQVICSPSKIAGAIAIWCAILAMMVPAAFSQAADAQRAATFDQLRPAQQRNPVVEAAVHHDTSLPLWQIRPAPRVAGHVHAVLPVPRPGRGGVAAADVALQPLSAQPLSVRSLAPATLVNLDGIGQGFTGPAGTFTVFSAPSDANGSAGPNQYVQIVNSDFAVFDKSGTAIYGPVPTNTLWNGFGGGCQANNDGEGAVHYDRMADRWVISQFSISSTPYLECVAVSQTPDPTGAYNRYSFSYGSDFPSFTKVGVWPDAYYVASNFIVQFSGRVCAYDRAQMLAGQPATQQCFNLGPSFAGLLPADLDGSLLPPAGAPNLFIALGANPNELVFWKFHTDWTTPANSTLTGPTTLATAPFSPACGGGACIPQAGTAQKLDSLADFLMYRFAYRNFADGHQSLVVNHSITAGAGVGVRWYELRLDSSGNPSIFQQGTYAPDSDFRWMGSAAMDQSGNIALGYSLSGTSLLPSINYTGRLAADPLGEMTQGEGTIIDGGGSQTGSRGLTRWGAYTMLAVDPADDCTFWYTNQYIPANGEFNWATRIASFKFPSCGPAITDDFSIAANPASISTVQGSTASTTIGTAVMAGNPQPIALSVTGLPAGATAAFSPASITAGGSSMLTVTTSASTPAGTYTLPVTGTSPAATHSAQIALTVTTPIPSDFSISATPSVISVAQGSLASSPVSTSLVAGSPETINLSVSGAPAGSTIVIAPGSVTTGGFATISVNPGTASLGSYSITVTGISPSATHSVGVTLKIVARFRDFSISIAPPTANLAAGGSVSYTISSSATNANVQLVALTVLGLPTGVTGTFNPSTIQAGNSGVLTLRATAAALPGTATAKFIVTGRNSFGTHSVTAQVSVTAPAISDFSVSVNPANLFAAQGGFALSTIVTTITAGTSEPLTLSLTGLPTDATATFSPTTLGSVGSYPLTIAAATTTPVGTYTLTLTATAATGTHAATLTLQVVSAGNGIVNGGFETGDFTGWTASGTTSVAASGAHSGHFAAMLGRTFPTNGNSSISQTFIVPADNMILSLWYKESCPDSPSYDWATATLKDNTAGTTTNVLSKTCADTSWIPQQVSLAGKAGHNVTLTLISHDDNYAGDPTYTLFDDISLAVASTPGSLLNGGFETGDLSGWISNGTTAVVSPGLSGFFGARLGSTVPSNGDSSISQTFTAPTGATKLSFWYNESCPDTSAFDWATARLTDNTSATSATILPKTCATTAGWRLITANLTAGHSYTLTLTNHDDNFPGDPTYTLIDDVLVLP